MKTRIVGASAGAWAFALTLALAPVAGCASQKANTERKSNTALEHHPDDLTSARDEITSEARQHLDELNDAIVILAVRLHDHGDAAQHAEWGQLLVELKQQRNRLDAELIAARELEPEAWQARQAALRKELSDLETAINNSALAIVEDLITGPRSAEAEAPAGRVELDLCHVQVSGTDAEVREEGGLLILHLTTTDPNAVEALQRRAEQELSNGGSPDASAIEPAGSSAQSALALDELPASHLQISKTPHGVAFIFAPTAGQMDALRAHLQSAAEQIKQQRC